MDFINDNDFPGTRKSLNIVSIISIFLISSGLKVDEVNMIIVDFTVNNDRAIFMLLFVLTIYLTLMVVSRGFHFRRELRELKLRQAKERIDALERLKSSSTIDPEIKLGLFMTLWGATMYRIFGVINAFSDLIVPLALGITSTIMLSRKLFL